MDKTRETKISLYVTLVLFAIVVIFMFVASFITSVGYNSYQTDFPDLTPWLNQNKNSGKKAGNDTVDALSGADHKARSGKVPNLNPMNKYINGGK